MSDRVATVPYAPVVGVAVDAVGGGVFECERRRGPVGDASAVFIHHFRERTEIHVLELLRGQRFHSFLLIVVVASAPAVVDVLTLVVATPQGERTVVADALHVVDRFLAYVGEEFLIRRIGGAGKHEILPYQDAVAVAEVVEIIVFIDSSAPYADHVHVDVLSIKHMLLVFLFRDTRKEIVEGNHVDALHEHRFSIKFEGQGASPLVVFRYQLQ